MIQTPLSIHYFKIIVLGGARSGKSRYAEKLAVDSGLNKVFVATAEAHDAEMSDRIATHRRERGSGWTTVEAPLALAEAIAERRADEIVVVDCLTLWLTNTLLAQRDMDGAISTLVAAVAGAACPIALVSNEVGMGIVPRTPLGRQFRDWQGMLNQKMARECDAVIFMAAGYPTMLKPSSVPEIILGQDRCRS